MVGDRAGSSRTQSSSNPNKGKVTRTVAPPSESESLLLAEGAPFFSNHTAHSLVYQQQAGRQAAHHGLDGKSTKMLTFFLNQELVISHSLLISRQVPREEETGTLACNAHHHASRRPCWAF